MISPNNIKAMIERLISHSTNIALLPVIDDAVELFEKLDAELAFERQEHHTFKLGHARLAEKVQVLKQTTTEQAAVIEKLREALWWLCDSATGSELQCIQRALATPTDSKQILADWMREQLGEPVLYMREDWLEYTQVGYGSSDGFPLFKLPECLK